MTLVMVLLLAYQCFVPSVNNGHYQAVSDGSQIYRMDTQNGTIERIGVGHRD